MSAASAKPPQENPVPLIEADDSDLLERIARAATALKERMEADRSPLEETSLPLLVMATSKTARAAQALAVSARLPIHHPDRTTHD